MSTKGNNTGELAFTSAADYSILERALREFAGSAEYVALGAHHEVASTTIDPVEKLLPVKLFEETLGLLLNRKSTPVPVEVGQIQTGLNRYVARLAATVDMLNGVARPVPNIMHFVWVGGSEVGNNQRDYMNIWREVLKSRDYKFNLWYDSDALLAFEMNRVILDSARVDAMESGGDKVTEPRQLSLMIENRARVLKQQMFDYLNQPRWAGRADEARIDLMARAYGKDRATLEAFRQRCLQTHQAMAGTDLQLRDVRHEFAGHFLQDVYQREVAMRGNFAAASDVVRLQAEYLEGGRYSDMDYLPPLAEKLGGVDISGFSGDERVWVLKLLLDHNELLMPGRDPLRYINITGEVPALHKEALTEFARSKPGVHEIFTLPQASPVPQEAIRLGTAWSDPVRGEMNAHMLAHPGAGMTQAIMEGIRFNYDCINEVERRMVAAGADWGESQRLLKVIGEVLDERASQGLALSHADWRYMGLLESAIHQYYADGIRPQARGTIVLTGPSVASAGVGKYTDTHLQIDQWDAIRQKLKLTEGYNVFTEEEHITGWTVNGDENTWLEKEQEKWRSGKLKSRYAGQLADLLKQQTLTFKQGWPVIEGKPVLLTSALQQLMNDLGEPFIRAMKDKLTGDVTFHEAFSIGFDTRQEILAQPAHELPPSHGAESTSNLNELFTRVAHGSLAVEQLSPLLRVMLGGIFGATSLDVDGFAAAWKDVSSLATHTMDEGLFARYNAIERALRQHSNPAFEAGQASAANLARRGKNTARELKVLALNDPLTLHQWGERIGQINSTAQREYHTQIFKRGAQVGAELFKAGAISVKQMPQDLLSRTPGDPGRRCYPLALMMAAALTAGESAERALIGRVSNATVAPEDADSRALLSALDELQSVPLTAVGKPQGSHSLESVVQTLAAKNASTVMLLDTGNHALLAAKIVAGSQTVYRFYEPNFAVYGFSQVDALKQGMQRYLGGDDGAMARLYGLAEGDSARFNVIELDTTVIAGKVLSSNTRLDSFLQNAPVVDARTASVWEKQAVGRQRSLSENTRMGASLAQLDARYWASEFDHATSLLRTEHHMGREYLPLLDSVKDSPDGGFNVTLVDSRNPQNTVDVVTRDARFSKLKKHMARLVNAAAGKPGASSEADGGSRLSFAFAIQTLITEMRQRDYRGGDQVPALTVALQIQVYVSYAQLGFGIASDALQIVNLVRQVVAGEQALRQASLSGRLLGRTATGVGFAFSLANIGFDIYNLSVAENHEQRSRFSISMAFNVASLGLDIVALAAGGVAGAAAAFLSVPLLGVGIGVTAIASNLGQIKDKATAVGNHLRAIHSAYQEGAFTLSNGILQFPSEAVITRLNLQDNVVQFDSQKFYPWYGGALELPHYNDDPKQIHKAINIRRAWGLPGGFLLQGHELGEIQSVVLPCTPICYYGYEYQVGGTGHRYEPMAGETLEPAADSEDVFDQYGIYFISTRYPQLRDSWADRLEYDAEGQRVFYLHSQPGPLKHILYKLHPVYKPTHISVQLNQQVRRLVVPVLPQEWQQKISYEVSAPEGQYQIRLVPGLLSVTFRGKAKWVVHAPWARLDQVTFHGLPWENEGGETQMTVDGIVLNAFEGFIELSEGLFQIGWWDNSLHLVSVSLDAPAAAGREEGDSTATGQKVTKSLSQVLAFLRTKVSEKRVLTNYVPLYNFEVPFNPDSRKVFTTAYYDTTRDRMLYARNLPDAVNHGLLLGGASASHAWFYHPDHATFWCVDAITGTVVRRYRLMNPGTGSNITQCLLNTDGSLHVSQRLPLSAEEIEEQTTVEYRIFDESVEMTAIKTSFLAHDYDFWRPVDLGQFGLPLPFEDGAAGMADAISEWSFAPFVVVSGYELEGLRDRAWINKHTGKRFHLTNGGRRDLLMLMPSAPENSAVLFYSATGQAISRGVSPKHGEYLVEVIERNIVEVSRTPDRYIATKTDGRLFEIDIIDLAPLAADRSDDDGEFIDIDYSVNKRDVLWLSQRDKPSILKFAGVGQHWLQQNPDWLTALPALASLYKALPFPIIGLGSVSGNVFLTAWCVDEKIALTEIGQGKEVLLLGLTPDRQAVWLLEVASGQLYRQPLVAIEALRGAFASGHRLSNPEHLPKAEKVWSQWSFTQVQRLGEGLVGQTREGVNMQLLDQQPASIVGVENRWSYVQGQTPEQLQARLQALLNGQCHAPVLQLENSQDRYKYYVPALNRLFDISGRNDGQWAVFLGTCNESVPLLYDPVDGLIFSRGSANGLWLPDCHARRDGKVLSLEMKGDVTDVVSMLPDGVDKLILAFGPRTLSYRVSDEAWQRLDCIVVDSRRPLGVETTTLCTLVLDMAANERLLMSLADGHLVISDTDNAHSLIVRDALSRDDEPDMPVQLNIVVHGQPCVFPIGQWLKALAHAQGDEQVVTLETVLQLLI